VNKTSLVYNLAVVGIRKPSDGVAIMHPDEKYDRTCIELELQPYRLTGWIKELAIISPVFREFVEQTLSLQDSYDMKSLWESASSPLELTPIRWFHARYQSKNSPSTRFDEDILYADWETFAWYTHDLEPRFTFSQLSDWCIKRSAKRRKG
jgi:hypothetical protein